MKWISVEESLPEFEVSVLGWNSDGLRIVSRWQTSQNDWCWTNNGSDTCGCCDTFDKNVTHWMPMIEGPEGV